MQKSRFDIFLERLRDYSIEGGGRKKIFYTKVFKDNQHPSRNFELNPLKGLGVIEIPRKFS